jgi:hypothetical protein
MSRIGQNDEASNISLQGPPFKLALCVFIGLGAIGIGLLIWLSTITGILSPQQEKLSEAADWLMKSGIGAIVGMLVDRRVR